MIPSTARLFETLHATHTAYCHWKSNDRLTVAAEANTDLDLLFRPADEARVAGLLTKAGFLRFRAPFFRSYPHIQDWLSVDASTGRIVHVHAHFRLVVGERTLKPYLLPWDDEVLDDRILDEEAGIYRSSREHELLLLLTRMVLKRMRGSTVHMQTISTGERRELDFLRTTVDRSVMTLLLRRHLGLPAARLFESFLENANASEESFRTLLHDSAPLLAGFRRMPVFQELTGRQWRRFSRLTARILKRLGSVRVSTVRHAPGRGIAVAVMGSDGSGKSTLLASATKAFSTKVDTVALYMGSGDGSASLLRAPLNLIKNSLARHGTRDTDRTGKTVAPAGAYEHGKQRLTARQIGGLIWSLALALEKRQKLQKLRTARRHGSIIICDRFPQITYHGFNDGPRLSRYSSHSSVILRRLAAWELRSYTVTAETAPDLVIKLHASLETLEARRPEMNRRSLVERQSTILSLPDYPGSRTLKLSSEQSKDEVLRAMVYLTWQELAAKYDANGDRS